jgi:hypothetical protein
MSQRAISEQVIRPVMNPVQLLGAIVGGLVTLAILALLIWFFVGHWFPAFSDLMIVGF